MKTDHAPPIQDRRAIRLGRIIDVVGQLMLPVALGALLGFYASDRGMRLLPDLLQIALGWTLGALLFIGLGRLLRGRLYVSTPEGIRLRKRVVALLALLGVALAARLAVYHTQAPSPLTDLPREQFEAAFEIDATRAQELSRELSRLVDHLDTLDIPSAGKDVVLLATEEALLLDAWVALNDYSVALDQIRLFYEDWYRFDPSRVERSWHLRSFLLTFDAELALYENATRFTARVLANPNARKFLDAPHPDRGLPADTFSHFRENLLGVRDQARVLAGERYLQVAAKGLGARREVAAMGLDWLWRDVLGHLDAIEAIAPLDRALLTARADTQLFKRGVRRAWFPVQAETADLMGDIRYRRIGWYLIPEAQQERADALLEPGDILVSRKNWYLSNVGLPGFWPHAILYLGAPDKLDAWSEDAGVQAWVEAEAGRPMRFSELLERRYPSAWRRYRYGDAAGRHRVIEAVGEGVIFNSLAHVAGDYFAGVRPRLTRKARAQAILEAFAHEGKPYDFDFDFATEHAVVCTELVWRAYRPMPGKEGLDPTLSRVAGRMTLPANEMMRWAAANSDGPSRLFDFVFFIDARERSRETFFSDEAAFRATPDRVKWDFVQQ